MGDAVRVELGSISGRAWPGSHPGHEVACPDAIAAAIAATSFESFRRFSRGGLETGGILLGERTESGVAVRKWLPIACEHARGPAFLLSEHDQEVLAALLAEQEAAGLDAIGWFVSHSRSALAATDADLELFQRFFPEPWQIFLIVKPAMDASACALICSRRNGAVTLGPEFRLASIRPGKTAIRQKEPAQPIRIRRMEGEHPQPPPGAQAVFPSPSVEPPRFTVTSSTSGSMLWVLVSIAMLCLVMAAVLFGGDLKSLLPGPDPQLGLRALDRQGQLRVEWNRASPVIVAARQATIDVNDGGALTKVLLNSEHLRGGSLNFLRQSDDVELVFTVLRADQPPVREWTRFIGQPVAAQSAVEEPSSDTDRLAELISENTRLKIALEAETARRLQQEEAVRVLRQQAQ